MTPQQLFDFVGENISGINTVYCSMDEWKFYNSTTKTTIIYSCVSDRSGNKNCVNPLWGKNRITKHDNIEFNDFKGFVTTMYDRN